MCQFCEILEEHKAFNKILNNKRDDKMLYEYTVAIVIHSWTKERGKRRAGRSTDYRRQGLGYKLNFCPECGSKIGGRK